MSESKDPDSLGSAQKKNFAVIGVGGYIAPRHLNAIKASGNRVVAALDKHDSVGILDSYFPDVEFFTEFERFDRHVEKLRRMGEESRIHYISISSSLIWRGSGSRWSRPRDDGRSSFNGPIEERRKALY